MFIIMSTLRDFSLSEIHETIRNHDILPEIDQSIGWEALRPMIRALFLQGLYNIVDGKLEKELYDRIWFHNFLHYPEKKPVLSGHPQQALQHRNGQAHLI